MTQIIVRDYAISSPFQKKSDPESTVVPIFITVQSLVLGM